MSGSCSHHVATGAGFCTRVAGLPAPGRAPQPTSAAWRVTQRTSSPMFGLSAPARGRLGRLDAAATAAAAAWFAAVRAAARSGCRKSAASRCQPGRYPASGARRCRRGRRSYARCRRAPGGEGRRWLAFEFPFWAKNHLPVLRRFLSLPDWLSPMSFLNRILINTWLFFV